MADNDYSNPLPSAQKSRPISIERLLSIQSAKGQTATNPSVAPIMHPPAGVAVNIHYLISMIASETLIMKSPIFSHSVMMSI
jgi:hypothetical protein